MKGQGFARRVTPETLEMFAPLLRSQTARSANSEDPDLPDDDGLTSPAVTAALELFTGEQIPLRHRWHVSAQGQAQNHSDGSPTVAGLFVHDQHVPALLWRKPRLAASDVQSQRGNPTGGVRLTQARFRTTAGLIDQTSYFRNDVFAELEWRVGKQQPFREDAVAVFSIHIRGVDYGEHRLRISHKPSGEAGQNNYTTILHWGELGELVRDLGLAGADLRLYSPPPNKTEPFLLVIT
jgi:hypothetical protein